MNKYIIQYIDNNYQYNTFTIHGENIKEAIKEFIDGTFFVDILGVFKFNIFKHENT